MEQTHTTPIEAPLKDWEARIVIAAALIVSVDTRRGPRDVITGQGNWLAVKAVLAGRDEVERIARRADCPQATETQTDRYEAAVTATDRIRNAHSMGGRLMQAKALA